MSVPLAAAIGAAAAAAALTVMLTVAFFLRRKRSRGSDYSSSDASVQGARCFKLEDLGQATNFFNVSNLIGSGKFGDVYKGLLKDTIVAIKSRSAAASGEFIREVEYLSSIRHRNLVSLLGYCQESGFQMLVYEYVPNGSISSHLYGANRMSSEKLEFKHRLSIALGAAKGLAFLHSLSPPLMHTNFKTDNLLVDENFVPKIADAGLRNFLLKLDGHIQSFKMTSDDMFLDPGISELQEFKEKNDVYSFGVFLLELVSGEAATELQFIRSHGSSGKWAQNCHNSEDISNLVDARMENQFTDEGIREFLQLASQCLSPPSLKTDPPTMSTVAAELDRILERERSLTTIMGEAIPSVTLGSELFTSS